MGQRWPLPNIIRSTSRLPAQPAAYPLTGRRTCTDHRADRLLMSVVGEGGEGQGHERLQQRALERVELAPLLIWLGACWPPPLAGSPHEPDPV
jgi:hypothetical protein